ncbi:hypothetical protein VII_002203 [Vibrio mimicus MB451]|nr:hypothetical protein VII_002203 [Vibrio mimicus MB451]
MPFLPALLTAYPLNQAESKKTTPNIVFGISIRYPQNWLALASQFFILHP